MKIFEEFTENYGILGKELQTEVEQEENRKRGDGGTVHFMYELPEYKEISDKYHEKECSLGNTEMSVRTKRWICSKNTSLPCKIDV